MFDSGMAWLSAEMPLPSSRTSGELIDLMAELHRLESTLVERKLAVVAELAARRIAEHEDPEDWTSDGVELAESEIGAALTLARRRAGTLIDLGTALRHRLRGTRAAMARGDLDLHRAGVISSATRNVSEELIGEVERECLAQALAAPEAGGTGLTGRRLSNAIDRIVNRIDPAGVRERRQRARNARYVGISSLENAMVQLFGTLPAAEGRKFDARLRELANTVCPRDGRTFDQRKADAINALVNGLTFVPCCCDREDCTQDRENIPTARKPLVHVIMLSSTLHAEDDEPGYLDGHGLIDADHARELAASADIEYVRVPDEVTAERGKAPLPESAYSYRPTAVLDTWIRILGGMCQWLHCDSSAWNADLDHDEPFDHDDPSKGGPTTADGMKPFCRPHHRLKHSERWRERHNRDRTIDLISPTGHRYRTRNAGYLDVLGIDPEEVIDPRTVSRPRRRTRAQNQAASIRAERRSRHERLELSRARRKPEKTVRRLTRQHERPDRGDNPNEDSDPCPF